jgi:hypothetical protein
VTVSCPGMVARERPLAPRPDAQQRHRAVSQPRVRWPSRAFTLHLPTSTGTIESSRADYFRSSSSGRPLSSAERAAHEPRLGVHLSGVRVHEGDGADAAARMAGAEAYAAGGAVVLSRNAGPATLRARVNPCGAPTRRPAGWRARGE